MTSPAPAADRPPSLVLYGAASGLVAGAAVLGLLVGIGSRTGTAWRPVNAAAHVMLGGEADGVWTYHWSVTPVGGLVVLTVSVCAGLIVVRLAGSLRTSRVAMIAAGVALLGYLVHVHVGARSQGGLSDLLSLGELRALYLGPAVALVAGLRFALSPRDWGSTQ